MHRYLRNLATFLSFIFFLHSSGNRLLLFCTYLLSYLDDLNVAYVK